MRKILFVALAFILAACGTEETSDRKAESGKRANGVEDVTRVTVYRNIDSYPNQAVFCIEAYAFRSTTHNDTRGADVDRFPEMDSRCPGGE